MGKIDFLFANRCRMTYVHFLTNSKAEKLPDLVQLIPFLPYPLLPLLISRVCNNKAGP